MSAGTGGTQRRRRSPRASRAAAERQEAEDRFLEALGTGRSIRAACQASNVPRSVVYRWRTEDPAFAERWDLALEDAADIVEDAILEHALAGDTRLLLALARVLRPAKWSGSSDTAVRVIATARATADATAHVEKAPIDWNVLDAEQLEQLARLFDIAEGRSRKKEA